MKFLAFLLLSLAAFAQSAPPKPAPGTPRKPAARSTRPAVPPPATAVAPDDGSLNENTYTSDYFGFRYTFPEGMGVDEDFMQGREDQSKRSFLLLAAIDREEVSNRMVVVMADNATAAGASDASSYLSRVATELLKRQGFQPEGAARDVTIAGHSFARADFRKQKIVETVLVTMLRGYAVNFVLTAPSREEAEELASSLQTLTFAPVKVSPASPVAR